MNQLKKLLTWSFPAAERDIGDFSKKERNIFSLGMFGQNLIYTMINTYLSVFYSTVIFVPAAALLTITVISRIWDAFNDLLMGTVVDKTHSRWGKCRPYLKYVPIPVAIFTVLMFIPIKSLSDIPKICFVIFTWLGWEFLYTLGDIPLWGMTSLMTPDAEKRTNLVSCARIIGGLSAVITVTFEPMVNVFASMDIGWFHGASEKIGYEYYSYQQGYFFTVLLVAVVGGVLMKLPFIYTRERVKPVVEKNNISFADSLKLMFKNGYYIRTMLVNILGSTRGLLMSAGIYFCMWVLADGGNYTLWLILLGGPFLAGTYIAMASSNFCGKKFGKIRTLKYVSYFCVIPYCSIFLIAHFLGTDSIFSLVLIAVCLFIAGFSNGFPSVYGTTMIEDSIDYMEWKTGARYDGVYLSGLNFSSKLTNAITLGITYAVFWIVNYSERIENLQNAISAGKDALNFTAEYPDITLALTILISLVPAVGCILQALPLHGYKLDEKMHAKIMADLKVRRAKGEKEENTEE